MNHLQKSQYILDEKELKKAVSRYLSSVYGKKINNGDISFTCNFSNDDKFEDFKAIATKFLQEEIISK